MPKIGSPVKISSQKMPEIFKLLIWIINVPVYEAYCEMLVLLKNAVKEILKRMC